MEKSNDIERLNQKVRRLRTLIEVNEVISSSLEIDTILENVMSISKKVMYADASSLMRIDEKTNELIYQVAQGAVGEKLKKVVRLKMGQGIAGTVAEEGMPLLLEDAYTHPKFFRGNDEATGYRTKSMITVPLATTFPRIPGTPASFTNGSTISAGKPRGNTASPSRRTIPIISQWPVMVSLPWERSAMRPW